MRTVVSVEGFRDGKEVLGLTTRLEALQRLFSSSRPLVGVLSAVIQVAALAVGSGSIPNDLRVVAYEETMQADQVHTF